MVAVTALVDGNSIEVLLNGGRIAIYPLATAPLDAAALNSTAFGGSLQVSEVVIKEPCLKAVCVIGCGGRI